MNKPTKFIVLILLCLAVFTTNGLAAAGGDGGFAIVTYVGNHLQERSARSLVKSIRKFGGEYRSAPVYIVLGDEANFPCSAMRGENIILLPLEMDEKFKDYPLAFKAFAAAQVEKAVKENVSALAWFDPACIVVGSLEELDLENRFEAALRPVSLHNNIGISPGEEPNNYWAPVYSELGLNYKDLPAYETVVDEKPIQPYFNCEIFSVDPRLGILGDWAKKLTRFLKDETYQDTACTTFLRRLFLHQAVLSAVIMARIDPGKIKPLSLKAGYPFAQHGRLSDRKKTESLNGLSAVIFDYRWDRDAKWMERESL